MVTMNRPEPCFDSRFCSFFRHVALGIVLLIGLAGCGSSGGSGSTDENPSGLYTSGTGTLDGNPVNDIIAFVQAKRIIAFSVTAGILIDGRITSIDDNDYTATVDVYQDGMLDQAGIGVSGAVTNGSRINGTLDGSGTAAGNFSITFDLLYDRGASDARISTILTPEFAGDVNNSIPNVTTTSWGSETVPLYDYAVIVPGGGICNEEGQYSIPDSSINIYVLAHSVVNATGGCTIPVTSDYTGFATLVDDAGLDATLIYAITNGTNSEFAVLAR